MSKRAIETELDDLNTVLLGDLKNQERYALFLKAKAEGNEHWQDRLVESLPSTSLQGPDPDYLKRELVLSLMALRAIYRLHTIALKFQLSQSRRQHQQFLELLVDEEADNPVPFPIQEHEDNPVILLGELYFRYHAYKRFAEQIVGVDLETWSASHQDGKEVMSFVERFLEVYSAYLDQANEIYEGIAETDIDLSKDSLPDKLPDTPLDQLALYEFILLENWFNEHFERLPLKPGYLDL